MSTFFLLFLTDIAIKEWITAMAVKMGSDWRGVRQGSDRLHPAIDSSAARSSSFRLHVSGSHPHRVDRPS